MLMLSVASRVLLKARDGWPKWIKNQLKSKREIAADGRESDCRIETRRFRVYGRGLSLMSRLTESEQTLKFANVFKLRDFRTSTLEAVPLEFDDGSQPSDSTGEKHPKERGGIASERVKKYRTNEIDGKRRS